MWKHSRVTSELVGLVEWVLFLLLMMFKLFLFASFTDTVFYETGALGFIKNMFLFLFYGQTFNYLRHDLVLVSFGFLVLLTFWVLFFRRRKRIVLLFILHLLLTLLIYADIIHFRYFGGFTSASELLQINQLGDVSASIFNLMEGRDILFWIDIIILFPLVIWILKKPALFPERRLIFSAFAFLFIGWFSLAQGMFQFYFDYGGKGILDKMVSDESVYNNVGLLGYHFYDARRVGKDFLISKRGVTEEKEQEIRAFFENRDHNKNETTFGSMEGKNVIVVQVEALQDFVLDRNVNGEEITPFLNELKADSMYFENFYHQAGQGRTSDADLLVNTSLYPLSSGSAFVRFPNHMYHTIASLLKEKGYATSVHHAFEPSFWNRNVIYPNWGYDTFFSKDDYVEGEIIGWGIGDKEFLKQSIDQMPEEPFYSFLITLTSHHPYRMPDKYHSLNLDGFDDALLKNYLQSVHYVDQAIEEFVDRLKDEGLWENSIVVFYGDHDAGFLEEGQESGLFATENKREHVDFLLEKDKIPLIIHVPDESLAETYETFGGQIDLAPTLFHLLGIDTEEQYLFGEDLLYEGARHPVVFYNQEVTDGNVWYEPSADTNFEQGSCYDVKTKEKIETSRCKEIYERGLQELDLSENMILGNWLKRINTD